MGAFPLGHIDTRSYMMLCGVTLLPVAFLKNLRGVSKLSFWNGVVHVVINAVVIGYCLTRAADWDLTMVTLKVDIISFPIALGVIVFSYTSQVWISAGVKATTLPVSFCFSIGEYLPMPKGKLHGRDRNNDQN